MRIYVNCANDEMRKILIIDKLCAYSFGNNGNSGKLESFNRQIKFFAQIKLTIYLLHPRPVCPSPSTHHFSKDFKFNHSIDVVILAFSITLIFQLMCVC